MKNAHIITVTPRGSPETGTGIVLTLESTSALLGILVSASLLIAATIRVVSRFNSLDTSIENLKEDLAEHIKAEGHERLVKRVGEQATQLQSLDKKLDLHLQDCTNRRDTTQMLLGQLNEKIDHKVNRLLNSLKDIEQEFNRKETYEKERPR